MPAIKVVSEVMESVHGSRTYEALIETTRGSLKSQRSLGWMTSVNYKSQTRNKNGLRQMEPRMHLKHRQLTMPHVSYVTLVWGLDTNHELERNDPS